jgi:PadR family transcriptional regulator PadR
MPSPRFPIPQGTLDMLILQILSLEPAHGYGIAQRLEQISGSVVQVNQGSLYPALHRLLRPASRRQLAVEKGSWARLSGAVNLIFEEGSR